MSSKLRKELCSTCVIIQPNTVPTLEMFPNADSYFNGSSLNRLSCLWRQVLRIQEDDVCLTLTSGGCNALNLCILGAAQVVAVDCNPAQSALLELKAVAIQCALDPKL